MAAHELCELGGMWGGGAANYGWRAETEGSEMAGTFSGVQESL